jgi:hypothetical protein
MEKVNPGIRLMSCGCMMNTTVQKDGTGRVDISPCRESCNNFHMFMTMAAVKGMEIVHKWDE